jgi:hypothetical protein
MKRIKMLGLWAIFLTFVYTGSYVAYRATHTEVWQKDGRPYVIYSSRFSYYLFRPISYIDHALTGMGSHIGPHQ